MLNVPGTNNILEEQGHICHLTKYPLSVKLRDWSKYKKKKKSGYQGLNHTVR